MAWCSVKKEAYGQLYLYLIHKEENRITRKMKDSGVSTHHNRQGNQPTTPRHWVPYGCLYYETGSNHTHNINLGIP
jgi:hypothetical protein